MQTAVEAVAPGGKVVQVGLDGQGNCCAPTVQLVFKEIDFTGSWLYTYTVNTALVACPLEITRQSKWCKLGRTVRATVVQLVFKKVDFAG